MEPSELEWLGFELALSRYFMGTPNEATILVRLIRRAGLTCRTPELAADRIAEEAVKVHVCRLRDQMRDLGFAASIENVKGAGYRFSESGAREIWDRVIGVVFHLSEAA